MFQSRRPASCAHGLLMQLPSIRERIIEHGGKEWRIKEVSAAAVPGAHRPYCLICESDDVVRRIWNYPDNWAELNEDDLLALCGQSAA